MMDSVKLGMSQLDYLPNCITNVLVYVLHWVGTFSLYLYVYVHAIVVYVVMVNLVPR